MIERLGPTRRQVTTDAAPSPPLPLSQAIVAGALLFVSGQGPLDPATLQVVEGDFEQQAERCLANVKAIVEAAGGSLGNAVKVNAYLKDLSDFPAFNTLYRRFFTAPWPARTTVQSALPFLIEVDVVVALDLGAR